MSVGDSPGDHPTGANGWLRCRPGVQPVGRVVYFCLMVWSVYADAPAADRSTFNATSCRTSTARVAELADALDLGSSGHSPWRFESSLSHSLI